MKELELKYYFEHMEEFRHNELFENCTYIWEPLSKINDYIKKKIVDKNIQIGIKYIPDTSQVEKAIDKLGKKTNINIDGKIGEFVNFSKAGIDVKTGQGILRLIKVKPEGKGEMLARDWANGLRN